MRLFPLPARIQMSASDFFAFDGNIPFRALVGRVRRCALDSTGVLHLRRTAFHSPKGHSDFSERKAQAALFIPSAENCIGTHIFLCVSHDDGLQKSATTPREAEID